MEDFIVCPLCGKNIKRLKKHLLMAKEHKELDVYAWLAEHPDIPTISEAEFARMSRTAKAYANSPEGKAKMKEMAKIAWSNEDSRKQLLEGRRRQHETEEFKALHREVGKRFMTQKMSEPEFFEKAMKNIQSKGKRIDFTMSDGTVIKVRSQLEYNIAKHLTDRGLAFRYEQDPIQYVLPDGTSHTYYVDFYIPSLDLAIEGKPKQLWNRDDTQIKLEEAKKHFSMAILVAYDLTELDSIIGSVTTTESISKKKSLRE